MNCYRIKLDRLSDPLAVAWAVVIGYLSLTPVERLPLSTPFSDKIEHFAAYSLLALLALLARKNHAAIIVWLLLIILYSALIELLQPYVNRYAELSDLAANALGAISGALIAALVLKANSSTTEEQ